MDREKQIETLTDDINTYLDFDGSCECVKDEGECFPNYQVTIGTVALAKRLVNHGWTKTIWHKVSENDLPPANTDIIFYACMISGTCYYDMGVYSHIEKLWYGNLCSTTNDRVIAWTELPEYKE